MPRLLESIKAMIPTFLRRYLRRMLVARQILAACKRDARQYIRHSSTLNYDSLHLEMLEARIAATYHVIEKGLSLEATRLGFGQGMVRSLISYLEQHQNRFRGQESPVVQCALSTLQGYVEYHEKRHYDVAEFRNALDRLGPTGRLGGILKLKKSDVLKAAGQDFASLCRSRRSVRWFASEPVDPTLIQQALELAQYAPSVCNRQPSRVHIVAHREGVKELLELQGGTRGFSQKVDKVLVITTNLHSFDGIGERNQGLVDGGMYAMNLLYALHYKGIGACPLIWCQPPEVEARVRALAGLPEYERLVLLIAVGHLPDEFEVAEAKRFPVDRVCRWKD